MIDDASAQFEPHRAYLTQVAHRMLGSRTEAEDAVQDAFLRWLAADRAAVDTPRAYLTRTVTRLCLDRMKSARAQREHYVGTWLPEPVVEDHAPDRAAGLADDLSLALLVMLERLTPLERAAFLMHDIFDMGFADIAAVLSRSEAAVRQLAARAREHVRDTRPRFRASDADASRLAAAFGSAMLAGDYTAVSQLLATDAVFYSDGGGKRRAALNPIYGRDRIRRFLEGVTDPSLFATMTSRPAWIDGMPGFLVRTPHGLETLALEVSDGAIVAIYAVRNPDKLRHLA